MLKPNVSEKAVVLPIEESIFTPRLQYQIYFPTEYSDDLSALAERFRPFKAKIKSFFVAHCKDAYHFSLQEYISRKGDNVNYVFQVDVYSGKSMYGDLQKEAETWEY